MLIEQAIYKYLAAQSGITDLVSTRIYYVRAPQDVTAPYIVFFKVSAPRVHSHDGGSGLAFPRFQFSCFASTYYVCKQVMEQLQTALQGYSGTMGGDGGVSVGSSIYESEYDTYEVDTELYHVVAEYVISHQE